MIRVCEYVVPISRGYSFLIVVVSLFSAGAAKFFLFSWMKKGPKEFYLVFDLSI